MSEELTRIRMIRHDLKGIPQYPLPSEYRILWYKPGYEKHWLDINVAADRYRTHSIEMFPKRFGTDRELLAQRQCYLADACEEIFATATAWFDDDAFDERIGLVHWLAIMPHMQGKGLSKPLLTIVCNRLRQLGHNRAFLRTATVRIPAINLYQKFGLVPLINTAEDLAAWAGIQSKLKQPFDLDALAQNIVQ